MRFEKLIVVADEFTTSDRPFALARRLAIAGDLAVEVVYTVVDDNHREGIPGWRLQRRLDAHGLSTAELRVLRGQEPELAVCEHLAGHDGSLILRGTSAGGHDGGPLLDHTAEAIMSHVPRQLLLLGPRQANPRRDEQLAPITVVDGASNVAALEEATDSRSSTFTNVQPELVEVLRGRARPTIPPASLATCRLAPSAPRFERLDAGVAVLSHLGRRRDAVVVVSSPRWSSVPSHWWATARRLVRRLPCPLLVVPAVGQEERPPAPGRRTQP
jgi:nucleotide-binding universal stress UspA family protein